MQSDHLPIRLGSVVSLQRGTTYKSARLGEPGPFLLGLGSIQRDGGFKDGSLKTYGGPCDERHLLKPGDIYVSLKDVTQAGDLLGAVARVPTQIRMGRLTQDTVKLCFLDDAYPRELLYWTLRSPEYRSYCRERATGTTNLGLARDDFLDFELPEPTEFRVDLVALLERIEERIDLLGSVNETLEATASALFKSWFIDFDPVSAKAEGREPEGMNADIAALFPSEFVDSQLGQIPKGWSASTLSEAFEINPSRKLPKGTVASYLDMSSAPTIGHCPSGTIQREVGSGSKFINGDTLLAKITPCLENGKTAHVDFLRDQEVGWGSTEFIVLRPKSPLPAYLGYLLARHEDFRQFAIQAMTGTSGRQRVDVGQLARYPLVVPDAAACSAFDDLIDPLRQRISHGVAQAATLASLRDAVLPRLLFGGL